MQHGCQEAEKVQVDAIFLQCSSMPAEVGTTSAFKGLEYCYTFICLLKFRQCFLCTCPNSREEFSPPESQIVEGGFYLRFCLMPQALNVHGRFDDFKLLETFSRKNHLADTTL